MNIKKFRSTLGQHPLAYMSAEFALDDRLPIYAGGLGVLAGDIVREANDLDIPFVAVGLFYKKGYFKQSITLQGEQRAEFPVVNTAEMPLELVVDTAGQPIVVNIPVKQEQIYFQIWEYIQGDVSVYLLDTDVPQNIADNRTITERLYGAGPANRILQEIVLGIGGVRALRVLHIHPSIFHLNESHSAFAIFEIAYHYMSEYQMAFSEAYEYARQKIIFTNHTLVPAGNEVFPRQNIQEHLAAYAEHLGLPMEQMLADGKLIDRPDDFSLSRLALNMACRVNTVSQLHSQFAKQLWPDITMPAITNGVHLRTWVSPDLKAQAPYFDIKAIQTMEPLELWRLHQMAKMRLIDEVKYRTGQTLNPNHLIVTWARRFAAYKRPALLLNDMRQLEELVRDVDRPVQIILAGKAHPDDAPMQHVLHSLLQQIKQHGLQDKVVFVPNYGLSFAEVAVAGSDVWLNTPLHGNEASGTSGMKSGANGVLQFSVSDGWIAEIDINAIGWEVPNEHPLQLYEILREQIVPLYYQRDAEHVPLGWVERMKQTIVTVWTHYSSRRMFEQYIELLYRPALELERKEKHNHNWRHRYRTRRIV